MPQAAIAIAALAVAAVGTTYSIVQGEKANAAQKQSADLQQQANVLQRQQSDLAAARQRRDAIKAARTAAGASVQTAANQGASNGSGAQGAVGSIQSQLGDTLSFLDTYNKLSDQGSILLGSATKAQTEANSAKSQANLGSEVAGLGMTVFSSSQRISNVFGNGGGSISGGEGRDNIGG